MNNHLIDAMRISEKGEIRSAALRLKAFVEESVGLRVALCHNIAINEPMLDHCGSRLATTVFDWTHAANDRWWRTPGLALESPIGAACRYESEPFWCNENGFHGIGPASPLNRLDASELGQRATMNCAIVIPVHLAFGQIGVGTFASWDPKCKDLSSQFTSHGDLLGILVRTFIARYVTLMCPPQRLPIGVDLNKKEVACLQWAALGKTDDEIGVIVCRSRATIRFHIQNASKKLSTVNRSQTLFKATQLGYIASPHAEPNCRPDPSRTPTNAHCLTLLRR